MMISYILLALLLGSATSDVIWMKPNSISEIKDEFLEYQIVSCSIKYFGQGDFNIHLMSVFQYMLFVENEELTKTLSSKKCLVSTTENDWCTLSILSEFSSSIYCVIINDGEKDLLERKMYAKYQHLELLTIFYLIISISVVCLISLAGFLMSLP